MPLIELRGTNLILFLTFAAASLISITTVESQIPAAQPAQLADTLFIKQIVLCKDVREREPVDVVEAFSTADKRGWCFVRVHNTKRDTFITFRWFFEDDLYFTLKAKVGLSKSWRTYSSVRLRIGRWRVEVVDEKGKMLEGVGFEVNDDSKEY